MGLGMFSVHHSPIAVDFGSASIKLLQVGGGDRPPILAAAELPVPDSIRSEPERVFTYASEWVPVALRDGKFKGRRAVISVPAAQTFIQHMQITETDGVNRDDLIKAQLQAQMGCPPHGVVVRSIEVCPVYRNGQAQKEMICIAITKDTVMRYVDLLAKCKLEVVGVHADALATIRAFDHIHRRSEDENTATLYIDMGWGGTRIAVTHGTRPVFARNIPIGGRHFDQMIASVMNCDMPSARAHRLNMKSPQFQTAAAATQADADQGGEMAMLNAAVENASAASFKGAAKTSATIDRRAGNVPPSIAATVPPSEGHRKAMGENMRELLDTMTDELSMCLRYHQGLFREHSINRAIFVGGESRQVWLCQHVVKTLRMQAQLGDPLARFDTTHTPPTPGLTLGQPLPGWAVPCGLCSAPGGM